MAEGWNGPEVCARAGNAATQATMRLFVVMMRTDPLAIIRHVALKSGAQFPAVAANSMGYKPSPLENNFADTYCQKNLRNAVILKLRLRSKTMASRFLLYRRQITRESDLLRTISAGPPGLSRRRRRFFVGISPGIAL